MASVMGKINGKAAKQQKTEIEYYKWVK